MIKHFIYLEWKSFFRSASLTSNLILKIVSLIFALFMAVSLFTAGIGVFYILKEKSGTDPLQLVNRFLIYYLFFDLLTKYFLQKNPILNIKPFMALPIKKNAMVHFTLGKSAVSVYNLIHFFFFFPFMIVLIKEGYPVAQVVLWHLGIGALIYCNNFLNILINKKDALLYSIAALFAGLGFLQYYGYLDITRYTSVFFDGLYRHPYVILIPLVLLALLYKATAVFFRRNLYLDAGLAEKVETGKTEQLLWLNQFGTLGTFLKNDIKMITRNKRSKATIIGSVVFIFYGLLFFTGAIETYDNPVWKIFAGIFVSGGFLFTFGQFVPSWDSAYYPLMMSQNVRYRDYLRSKWWLMVIATVAATLLASFYLYFGVDAYLAILAGAVYNIGVNAHLVLWGGAYVKTPIDLTTAKKAFGNSQGFNAKTLLLSLPKLMLPMALYAVGHFGFHSPRTGFAIVVGAGIAGFAFKNKVFGIIENIYKKEKYKTLHAYKENA